MNTTWKIIQTKNVCIYWCMAKRNRSFGIMLKPLDSHKPANVFTFLTTERMDLMKKLKEFKYDKGDRLADNYKKFDWFDCEAISVYIRQRNIVGFSSMNHRPDWYDTKEIRILNRYYESKVMRRTSKVFADDHVCEMVKQQLKMAKRLGYQKAFISRKRSPQYFKKFIKTMSIKTKQNWIL